MDLINVNQKIFVAGKGLVGGAVVKNFKKNGYQKILNPSRSELNLLDYKCVNEWFEINKPDIVILAAAKVGGIYANNKYPADFILENLKIQNNVIETAWRSNVKRLLFLGSSCIYPKYSQQPIKEEYLMSNYLEETNSSYAIAKISGIKLCDSLREQYGFDAISLMPTNLYGEGDNYHPKNSHVIPALIRKFHQAKIDKSDRVVCWGSGNALREFMHVEDLANACRYVLEKWNPGFQSSISTKKSLNYLNVGTGLEITIKNLAEMIARVIDFNGQVEWDISKGDGTPRKLLDVSKIEALGWKASINLEDGIKKTIESFKNEFDNSLRE